MVMLGLEGDGLEKGMDSARGGWRGVLSEFKGVFSWMRCRNIHKGY